MKNICCKYSQFKKKTDYHLIRRHLKTGGTSHRTHRDSFHVQHSLRGVFSVTPSPIQPTGGACAISAEKPVAADAASVCSGGGASCTRIIMQLNVSAEVTTHARVCARARPRCPIRLAKVRDSGKRPQQPQPRSQRLRRKPTDRVVFASH